VWLDESVGPDESGVVGAPDHLDIQVEGQEYTADVNYDLDHDGIDDSAAYGQADGTVVAYIDADHDGQADGYLHVAADGSVIQSAHFDQASGNWVASEPPASDTAAVLASTNAGMTSDLHGAPVVVGPATVDSDGDGRNDTAVVQNDQGGTELVTDTNGDGHGDVDTVIDKNGVAVTFERGADGHWNETHAHADSPSAPPASDNVWGSESQNNDGADSERWV